jgi:hypothetical protein
MKENKLTNPAPRPVFISYSHKNTSWKDELAVHLAVLQGEGLIDAWDDDRIEAGSAWAKEIDAALDAAQVAILLVSAHFLTSRFILREEVPRVLKKVQERKLRIMPVILEACLWKRVPWLAALQARPREGRQLSAGTEAQRAQDWTDICEEIAGWLEADRSSASETSADRPNEPESPSQFPDVAPATGTIETAIRSGEAAGDTVRDLATAAANDPKIERILANFRKEFSAASRSIESLTDYKEMHDELHNFEFQILPRLLAASRLADEAAQEELERCIFDLDATVNHLRAVNERNELTSDAGVWINTLGQALSLLENARDQVDSKEARKACILLSRVLNTEPSRINDRMRQIAEKLDLQPLIAVLERGIPTRDLDRAKLDALKSGVDSLKLLEKAMRTLIKEHDNWQQLEGDLRLIDNSLPRTLEELELLWPDIEKTTNELTIDCSESWALQLRNETARLSESLNKEDPNRATQVISRFRLFRRRAGQRFFQVDANLRETFEKLANVGEPLMLLLRATDKS